eukprot:7376942-Prymnesium_polylepis.1
MRHAHASAAHRGATSHRVHRAPDNVVCRLSCRVAGGHDRQGADRLPGAHGGVRFARSARRCGHLVEGRPRSVGAGLARHAHRQGRGAGQGAAAQARCDCRAQHARPSERAERPLVPEG